MPIGTFFVPFCLNILKRSLHWHKKLLKDFGRVTLIGFAKQKKNVLYKSEIYVIFIRVIYREMIDKTHYHYAIFERENV